MKLVVIIPALNEDAAIAGVIKNIPAEINGIDEIETVVVDDGSTDRTVEAARECGASVISHPEKLGLGAAFRIGIEEAKRRRADVAVNIDADGQLDPGDISRLVEVIVNGGADVAIGSRFKDPRLAPEMRWLKLKGNLLMARLVSTLAGRKFHDVSCGLRAYSREAFQRLELKGNFTYTHESILFFAHNGFRIEEVPVSARGAREAGESKISSNLLLYAIRSLAIIFRYMLRRTRIKHQTLQNP